MSRSLCMRSFPPLKEGSAHWSYRDLMRWREERRFGRRVSRRRLSDQCADEDNDGRRIWREVSFKRRSCHRAANGRRYGELRSRTERKWLMRSRRASGDDGSGMADECIWVKLGPAITIQWWRRMHIKEGEQWLPAEATMESW